MKFILRKDIPTLVKGEIGICLDRFSIVTYTEFEGLKEHSLKDLTGVPVTLLEEVRNFLNEAYADIKGFFIVKFIIDSVETPVAAPNRTKVAAISIPERTGYTSAWQLNGSNFNFNTLITSNISLLPAYTVIAYNIIYNLNDGTGGDTPTTYTIETPTITLGTPTRTGYIFDGWFNNVELTGEPVTEIVLGSTGNIELWAGWTAE